MPRRWFHLYKVRVPSKNGFSYVSAGESNRKNRGRREQDDKGLNVRGWRWCLTGSWVRSMKIQHKALHQSSLVIIHYLKKNTSWWIVSISQVFLPILTWYYVNLAQWFLGALGHNLQSGNKRVLWDLMLVVERTDHPLRSLQTSLDLHW